MGDGSVGAPPSNPVVVFDGLAGTLEAMLDDASKNPAFVEMAEAAAHTLKGVTYSSAVLGLGYSLAMDGNFIGSLAELDRGMGRDRAVNRRASCPGRSWVVILSRNRQSPPAPAAGGARSQRPSSCR